MPDERGIVSKSKLTALASAIKTKASVSGTYTLDDLVDVVDDIGGGGGGETITLSAVFDAGENKIFTTDSLDDLKQYLTVTATVNTTPYVLADDAYTLSGSLAAGENTITVSALGKTAAFTVSGVIAATDMSIDLSSFTNVNGAAYYLNSTAQDVLVTKSNAGSYPCVQTDLLSFEGGYKYKLSMKIKYYTGTVYFGFRNASSSLIKSQNINGQTGDFSLIYDNDTTQNLRISFFVNFGSSAAGYAVLSNVKLIKYQEVAS